MNYPDEQPWEPGSEIATALAEVKTARGRLAENNALSRLFELVAGESKRIQSLAMTRAERKCRKTKRELNAILDEKITEHYRDAVNVEQITKIQPVDESETVWRFLIEIGEKRATVELPTSGLMAYGPFLREVHDSTDEFVYFPDWEDTLNHWTETVDVATEHRERRPEAEKGFVYLMEHEHGFVKIGRSKSPQNRCSVFNTASPYDIELAAAFESDDAALAEGRLHEKYARYRTTGEWFDLPADVLHDLKLLYEAKARGSGRGVLEGGRFK